MSDMVLPSPKYCVCDLMPEGVALLAGAPKSGKSFLALSLGLQVAKGLPFLDYKTVQGDVLYLALEDTLDRIQIRLNTLTDDPPANIYFATKSGKIGDYQDDLCMQIRNECIKNRKISLVIIDTFQLVQPLRVKTTYATEYDEISALKEFAQEWRITLLLVHHLRKMPDNDPVNLISGTTGLSGAVDTLYVLSKDRFGDDSQLYCTGRDIEQRILKLHFDRQTCLWQCVGDSREKPDMTLPTEMQTFVEYIRTIKEYCGTNTELVNQFNNYAGTSYTPKTLKHYIKRWRYLLKDCGVSYTDSRTSNERIVKIRYIDPHVQVDDATPETST